MIKYNYSAMLVLLGLMTFYRTSARENLPALNKKILEYVDSVIGQQVDRGECWDLAYQALTRINAEWDGKYKYGRELKRKEKIEPGDVIQFKDVKVRYQVGNTVYSETMAHHTAIVYRVLENDILELAHQNTGFSGKTVGLSKLNLNTIIAGRLYIYRPVAK
jgi:signal peptidase I